MTLNARPFVCAPGLKIDAQERLASLQFTQVREQLARVDEDMVRLEKRLWLTVYGVLASVLAQGFVSFMAGVGE